MFNGISAQVKALSAKFEDSKDVNTYITSVSVVPSSYSIKPPASVEIADPSAGCNKHKYMFTVNRVKWDEKPRVLCFARKLGPFKYERYSKFVLPKELYELTYFETVQTMELASHRTSLYSPTALSASYL
ncbi:unnamed protein product [Hymenolepis diminuta]|uniref:Uncharacterized protein n=1 Tax=Hymenolepis diminuta TaxID=6216 RepID=A0A564ZF57_HYMDI|nr:unnamed protein product [Hymenolepis diminuta]